MRSSKSFRTSVSPRYSTVKLGVAVAARLRTDIVRATAQTQADRFRLTLSYYNAILALIIWRFPWGGVGGPSPPNLANKAFRIKSLSRSKAYPLYFQITTQKPGGWGLHILFLQTPDSPPTTYTTSIRNCSARIAQTARRITMHLERTSYLVVAVLLVLGVTGRTAHAQEPDGPQISAPAP